MSAKRRRSPAYAYPFGPGATTGRIDQGQDFGGTGSIRSIGRAQIIKTGAPGWPGGAGVLYKLLEGAYAGRYVYVYEGVKPTVRAGQVVEAGQPIGQIIPGTSTGIETGWANSSGEPISHGEYTEGKETRGGKSFAAFLSALKKRGEGSSDGEGFSSFGPLGTAEEIVTAPSRAAASLIEGIGGEASEQAGNVANEVVSGIVGDLAKSAEPLMLNVALIGGGAFLVYYGTALMMGIKNPGAKLAGVAALPVTKGEV